jgi:hypothetical protein
LPVVFPPDRFPLYHYRFACSDFLAVIKIQRLKVKAGGEISFLSAPGGKRN